MTDNYLGDGLYADVLEDGAIVLRTLAFNYVIFLERDQQITLAGLIERRRRDEANTTLTAEGIEA